MRLTICFVLGILFCFPHDASSQACTTLGQTPATAFPVCGTASFQQNSVPLCGGTSLPTICTGGTYSDINPFWYRFTCFTSGTLAFVIDPINNNDDYDWVLFDITGVNPNDVYSNGALNIAENWSATPGNTGTSNNLNGLRNCAGGTPNFSSLPTLVAGRNYMLMISNWSASQVGYSLTFLGGTAVIADPLLPVMQSVTSNCDGTQLVVRFNKKVQCSSIAANGTDFFVAGGTVAAASGFNCTSSFDTDSALITLSAPLAPGNYVLTALPGMDGNTVLDNCGTGILSGTTLSFTVLPGNAMNMGSVNTPACTPATITLTFPEAIRCSSIAADGSDFVVTGPSGVVMMSAAGVSCTNGESTSITLQFAAPVITPGNYFVTIANGTDGNTLLGSCNRMIPAGSNAGFTVLPQPPLAAGTIAPPPCTPSSLTVTFADPVNCNSVAANGSDFAISGPGTATITGATAVNCANGMTNIITIQFAGPLLAPGNYQLQYITGTDGNGLVGNCNRTISPGSTSPFTLAVQPPLPMGTIAPVNCAPSSITIDFPELYYCSSLSPDVSEFVITGPSAVTVTSATLCNATSTSITLQLSAPISVSGNYQVQCINGTDGNTLTGDCNRSITAGATAGFTVPAAPSSIVDSIGTTGCAPGVLRVYVNTPIRCSSIASDGSDFQLTGPAAPAIQSASATCDGNGMTSMVSVQLASPIVTNGIYTLQLVGGSDGNTLLNDCYRPTPQAAFSFPAVDTVSAVFQQQVQYDCQTDVATFSHDGAHQVNSWAWTVDGAAAGNSATMTQSFSSFSQHTIALTVSNGTCSDTFSTLFVLNNKATAAFGFPDIICPEDSVVFTDASSGLIETWQWNFGNGVTSNLQQPPAQVYPVTGVETPYAVSLTVSNSFGCTTTATEDIRILGNCVIAVPGAFTPNGDGLNDYLYPLNAFKAEKLNFSVYNRWGQQVFHSTDWTQKWDGRIGGIVQTTGVYVWVLSYVHRDTKVKYFLRGTSTLIR